MLNQNEINKLKSWCSKTFFEPNNMAIDSFDFAHEVDTSLEYHEAKEDLRNKLKTFLKISPTKAEVKNQLELEQHEQRIIEEKNELERLERERLELEKIRNTPETKEQEEIYSELDGLLGQVVLNPKTRGIIVVGATSLGKTYRAKKVMEKLNISPKDYLIHSGHTTNLQFYIKNHNAPDKIHIYDDESILENKTLLNMIKAMLNGDVGIVEYDTSRRFPDGVKKQFKFTGKIILLLNEMPSKSEHLNAVKNRVLFYRLELSRHQIMKLLYERAKQEEIDGASELERIELVDWIKRNTNGRNTINLNYRLYEKVLNFYIQNKKNWKKMALSQIDSIDNYTMLIIEGLNETEWCKETGLKRSSYYFYKHKAKAYSPEYISGLLDCDWTADTDDKTPKVQESSQYVSQQIKGGV